ncbi:exosortase A [Alteromonas sp. H39]|uniref:exosortase A n=1 Tax=Alteromonas sp. H39 TaxID=3389876 RepID=UPI0039DF2BE1
MFRDEHRALYLYGVVLLLCWIALCWQGIYSAAEIWWGNEIFNHGFFVIPATLYLISRRLPQLSAIPLKPSKIALLAVIPLMLIYITGLVGGIQLFMHVAAFTLFPCLIWLLIGTRAALCIAFPLLFVLFSIPVGEQLIPYLQEITADGSVALLKMTGVPLYRNGLYIEIPGGRFLVAEACSGVSFFIVSIVIGSLYAYLNFTTRNMRAMFVVISLVLPVVANVLRVYGIILIAYNTDMEYAAGADHLIYGWFFFAFVLLCLLGVGEILNKLQKPQVIPEATETPALQFTPYRTPVLCVAALSVAFTVWANIAMSASERDDELKGVFRTVSSVVDTCEPERYWRPQFDMPSAEKQTFIDVDGSCRFQFYQAWFDENENELVSDLNKLYDEKSWSLVAEEYQNITLGELDYPITIKILTSPSGERIRVIYWYDFGDKFFTSKIKAKFYQIYLRISGQDYAGKINVIAIPEDATFEQLNINQLIPSL